MKKICSFILTLAMVLGTFSTSFAFEDVSLNNGVLVKAVDELSNLAIIQGYEDGSFKPKKDVTRAEMAKMLIAAKGLESFATASNTTATPKFTDCEKHWAKGYISLANDLGIINGRGDGIFSPNNPVTYEEASVMLLRTLGYTDESLNGDYAIYDPVAYTTKASSLGLLADIHNITASGIISHGDIDMKSTANRGDIALMLNMCLEQPMVISTGGTTTAADSTLIDDHYKNKSLSIGKDAEKKEIAITPENIESYSGTIDMSPYLYQTITAYVNADNKIVFVVASHTNTVKGFITNIHPASSESSYCAVWIDDEKYLMDMNGKLTINSAVSMYTDADFTKDGRLIGSEGTFILSDTDIVEAAIMEIATRTTQASAAYVSGKVKYEGVTLPLTEDNNTVDYSKITVTGDASSMHDIRKDYILTFFENEQNSKLKIIVSSKTLEGKCENLSNEKCYVNGEAYDIISPLGPAISIGDEGTFHLDYQDAIAGFTKNEPPRKTTKKSSKSKTKTYTGPFIIDSISPEDLWILNTESSLEFNTGATFTLKYTDGGTTNGAIFGLPYLDPSSIPPFSTIFEDIETNVISAENVSKSAVILEKYTLYSGKVKDLQMRELKEVTTSSGALEIELSASDVPTYYLYQDSDTAEWHFEATTKGSITNDADGEICKVIEVPQTLPDDVLGAKYTLIIIMREPNDPVVISEP